MATMEIDYNLKSVAKLFKLFPCVLKKTRYYSRSWVSIHILKCLWSEFFLNLVLKFTLSNTRFQSLRRLALKVTILSASKVEPFCPQKWYLNRAVKIGDTNLWRYVRHILKSLSILSSLEGQGIKMKSSLKKDAIPTRDTVGKNHQMPFSLMHWWPLCSNETRANQLNSRPSIVHIGS